MSARIGVVCGLAAEAECFGQSPGESLSVRIAGASASRAHAAATALVGEGCRALVSFGVAGGLDPLLRSGTLVVADTVVSDDRAWPTSETWRDAVRTRLSGALVMAAGTLAGRNDALTSSAAKAAVGKGKGAIAVDMESHGVAAAAASAGVPFLVMRAIADPAERAIPDWITDALAPDGTVIPEKITGRLFARPWTVWTLIGLARENGRALRSLRKAAEALGPALAWPDR